MTKKNRILKPIVTSQDEYSFVQSPQFLSFILNFEFVRILKLSTGNCNVAFRTHLNIKNLETLYNQN